MTKYRITSDDGKLSVIVSADSRTSAIFQVVNSSIYMSHELTVETIEE